MNEQIYLDFNASTPLAPEVFDAMTPYLGHRHANPSSRHWAAAGLRDAINLARKQAADLIGASPDEIFFTSGGSESSNWAIKGYYLANRDRGRHVITSAVEHACVLSSSRFLEQHLGARLTILPVDRYGMVDPDDLRNALADDSILVSIMHANNEVGTIQPIAELTKIARERGIGFYSDTAQTIGKIPVNVDDLGIDMLAIAGHKVYGPKGIGALYVRKGTPIEPLIHGAGHESGMRSGTESTMQIIGLGAACKLAAAYAARSAVRELRNHFWNLMSELPEDRITMMGHPTDRLPNTLNVCYHGTTGAELLSRIPNVAASTGRACHDGGVIISETLKAMNIDPNIAKGAVRWSLGRTTTKEQIETVAGWILETSNSLEMPAKAI
jgi:cysteine desulfurase